MRQGVLVLGLAAVAAAVGSAGAQQAPTTQLTIYNDSFAVVRSPMALTLHAGENEVVNDGVTRTLEPDSVVLRDPTGQRAIPVLEQNYDAATVDMTSMLTHYEGKSIECEARAAYTEVVNGQPVEIPAKLLTIRVVRATPQLFEIDGHLQFNAPCTLRFPVAMDGMLLKPTLRWKIAADRSESFAAELDYITHGISWQASYNLLLPESPANATADRGSLSGWITVSNESGTDFPNAAIQLMAGDVAKIQQLNQLTVNGRAMAGAYSMAQSVAVMPTEQAFDDFHLYDLHRSTSLMNHQTKQVQFLDISQVQADRSYEFDGNNRIQQYNNGYFNNQRFLNDTADKRVMTRVEVKNTKANHLGLPLPSGRIRLYRQQSTGQVQFVGESMLMHTPADQPIVMTNGYAFDLTAERSQTDFHETNGVNRTLDETFAIVFSNAKDQAVTIHDVEHMNRGLNWQITAKSADFVKRDSTTVEFAQEIPAHGKATLTYTVHYSTN